jgi:hypothetical protein
MCLLNCQFLSLEYRHYQSRVLPDLFVTAFLVSKRVPDKSLVLRKHLYSECMSHDLHGLEKNAKLFNQCIWLLCYLELLISKMLKSLVNLWIKKIAGIYWFCPILCAALMQIFNPHDHPIRCTIIPMVHVRKSRLRENEVTCQKAKR